MRFAHQIITITAVSLLSNAIYAQSGCIDPFACNFDPGAIEDDGSCYYSAPNDACADALALAQGVTEISNSCSSTNGSNPGCWSDGVQNDVWFSFLAPSSGQVVISCSDDGSGSLTDTQIAVYSDCNSVAIACDDDSGDGSHARVTLGCDQMQPGNTYYIQLDGFNGDVGSCLITYEVADVQGCTDPDAVNYDTCATIDDGSCSEEGCTDPQACNFQAAASIDNGSCCYSTCATVIVTPGAYPMEMSFRLLDENGQVILETSPGDGAGEHIVCLGNGCYLFELNDTYGDGWNGATFTIIQENLILAEGDFPNEPFYNAYQKIVAFTVGGGITGCTDPSACNYDPSATCDDLSCDYDSCAGCMNEAACNYNPAATIDNGSCCFANCVTLELYDMFGDLWDEGYYSITDAMGNEVVTGTMTVEAESEVISLCLEDGCYWMYVYPGNYPDEISWVLYGVNEGAVFGDGYTEGMVHFSVGDSDCYGCTDPEACTYDPFALFDDGTCISGPCVNGDNPWTAIPLNLVYNQCVPANGTIEGATTTAVSNSEAVTGEDVWYSFTAIATGMSFQLTTDGWDGMLELQTGMYETVDQENLVSFSGTERLNVNGLTVGQTYTLAVRNHNSANGQGNYSLCVRAFRPSNCNTGYGPHNLCGNFKAKNVGCDNYIFNFTDVSTGEEFTHTSAPGVTVIRLSDVPGLSYGREYQVRIDARWNLAAGDGTEETVISTGIAGCTIATAMVPVVQMRSIHNCATAGALPLNTIIAANAFVCGATAYEWEFSNVNGVSDPIFYTVNAPSRFLQLAWVNGLENGQTYNVRVRALVGDLGTSNFGPTQCLLIASLLSADGGEDAAHNFEVITAEEQNQVSGATIFPNPNDGTSFAIAVPASVHDVCPVIITDISGRIVWQQVVPSGVTSVIAPGIQLSSGLYLITIGRGTDTSTTRMIVR